MSLHRSRTARRVAHGVFSMNAALITPRSLVHSRTKKGGLTTARPWHALDRESLDASTLNQKRGGLTTAPGKPLRTPET